MHSSNRLAFFNLYHLGTDIITLFLSYEIAYLISNKLTNLSSISDYYWVLVIYIPLWVFLMGILKMYNTTTFTYYDRIFRSVLISSTFSSLTVAALMYAIKESMYSRVMFVIFFIVALVLLLIEKYTIIYFVRIPYGKYTKQVMIIGNDSMYKKFNYYVNKTNIKINIVRFENIEEKIETESRLVDIEYLQAYLKEQVIDEIIFAIPVEYIKEVQRYVLVAEEMGISSVILLDLAEQKFSKINIASLGTLPMVTFHSISLNKIQILIKRILDIIGSIIGIILSIPFAIIFGLAIKIDSPGPIIYCQNRVGQNGRIFKFYKFRSMYIDADERKRDLKTQNLMGGQQMFKVKDDPRITKVGKFIRKTSIDELPQFINVLKGDMSLVGTRPPTEDEVGHYENYHWRRISMKPGITGIWQVSGRNKITDFDEVVNLDTKYIDEWSVWLDIKIIIKTIFVIFAKIGAL